jgi:vacuolar-type H+-ATPase subunit F/Vma7
MQSDKIKGCVMGERDIIRIFSAFSFHTIPVHNKKEFNQELRNEIHAKKYRFFIVTETFIQQISPENEILIQENHVIVISIPTNTGSRAAAIQKLSNMIRRAVGIDIVKSEGESHE